MLSPVSYFNSEEQSSELDKVRIDPVEGHFVAELGEGDPGKEKSELYCFVAFGS